MVGGNKMYYKDAIIIRFAKEAGDQEERQVVRVVSDTEFINEFKRRTNDPFWKSIDAIQTTVKAKIGLGKPFIFTFNSPCYKKDPFSGKVIQSYEGELHFDFKQFGQEDTRLMQVSPIAYCVKACHKIGFYLLKIHDIHLLRLKAEFYQDEHGRIWLFHCADIWTRSTHLVDQF